MTARAQAAEHYTVANGIVTAPNGRTTSQGWQYAMDEPCGGVSTNGAEPRCCETHMLPWGHNRPTNA